MIKTEALVVGSGFGGSVAALRLGQAGVPTVVLERGRRWTLQDTTANTTYATFAHIDKRAEWLNEVSKTPGYEGVPIGKYPGILEVLPLEEITLLAGAAVGGGSHVYGGILIQPPGELWPTAFPEAIPYEEMDRVYFPRVLSEIKTALIPDDILDSEYYLGLKVLVAEAKAAGFEELESTKIFRDGYAKFPMAVDWETVREEIRGEKVPSVIAAEFWFGNNSGAKQSLDRDYLKRAEATGNVSIRPLHQVTEIAEAPDGYRIECDLLDEETGEVTGHETFLCNKLFLAAGSYHTTGLLLRAQSNGTLPRLPEGVGQNFGNDGDVFLIRNHVSAVTNPHLGGPGAIAFMNYKNETAPCVMMRAPFPRFASDFPDLRAMGTFVFTNTQNRGAMTYNPETASVQVRFHVAPDTAARSLAERLNAATGGELVSIGSRTTGHQLGGACMGQVCDTEGRVTGCPGLYVVDGALIPGSTTCVNPALTIAAIAERCLEHIISKDFTKNKKQ